MESLYPSPRLLRRRPSPARGEGEEKCPLPLRERVVHEVNRVRGSSLLPQENAAQTHHDILPGHDATESNIWRVRLQKISATKGVNGVLRMTNGSTVCEWDEGRHTG